jgi:hypothetical protein
MRASPALELGRLAGAELAGLQALFDPVFLIDVALDFRTHGLR